jgi:Asp/Glu/hydantoin racemase
MKLDSPRTVYALHTSFVLVEVLAKEIERQIPGLRLVNIVDDGLLPEIREAGYLTPAVVRRMLSYGVLAASAGADAIFNCCSSVGEAADLIRQAVEIPVVKIDDAMAEDALSYGSRVAIVATVPATIGPTSRLLQHKARAAGNELSIFQHVVDGAFDILMAGDLARHDAMVADEVYRAAEHADVILLAQASMARLTSQFEGRLPVPVLSSLGRGIGQLKRVLEEHRQAR